MESQATLLADTQLPGKSSKIIIRRQMISKSVTSISFHHNEYHMENPRGFPYLYLRVNVLRNLGAIRFPFSNLIKTA